MFKVGNLQHFHKFWEEEILKDHSNKIQLLPWIKGVKIEDFLLAFSNSTFKRLFIIVCIPTRMRILDYVPPEFENT